VIPPFARSSSMLSRNWACSPARPVAGFLQQTIGQRRTCRGFDVGNDAENWIPRKRERQVIAVGKARSGSSGINP